MSMGLLFSNAASGLRAAQAGLRVTSDNVANIENPRYVRKTAEQNAAVAGGAGAGVEVSAIRRAADQFLQVASMSASSGSSEAAALANMLDQVQARFGSPTDPNALSSRLEEMFAAFTRLAAAEPTQLSRTAAIDASVAFFYRASDYASALSSIRVEADARLNDALGKANTLLESIAAYNLQISQSTVSGADITGLQQRQSELVDELSTLIDVRLQPIATGGMIVRAFGGREVAGLEASKLSVRIVGEDRQLLLETPGLGAQTVSPISGAVRGYMDFNNTTGPNFLAQLNELTSKTADVLNRIHNEHTSAPPPTTITGGDVGDPAAALSRLTGQTIIGLVAADGSLVRKITVDVTSPGGGTVDGTPFTNVAEFVSGLNGALSPATATLTTGRLSLDATALGAGTGVAIMSAPLPSAAPGFSSIFRLNDLVEGEGSQFAVRADILERPQRLSTARPDLTGVVGATNVVLGGDTRGADALGQAGALNLMFVAVGDTPGGLRTLSDYMAGLGASVARKADAAEARRLNEEAVAAEVATRRASVEGVNLDEELVRLTTYQQAYAASARVMKAATDVYDVLLSLGR